MALALIPRSLLKLFVCLSLNRPVRAKPEGFV